LNPPPFVRKRDGRVVPFDQGKIADAIYRASLAAGGEDRFLSEELASLVTLFLVKSLPAQAEAGATATLPGLEGGASEGGSGGGGGGESMRSVSTDALPVAPVPGIEQIQDIVEKVLIETGHAATARAYILYRDRRARLRDAASARAAHAEPTLFDDGMLLVEDSAAQRTRPFSVERLSRTVAAEAEMTREDAVAVADEVHRRLRTCGVRRVPSALVASLLDSVLLERGRLRDPRARSGAILPRAVVEASLAADGRYGAAVPPERAARLLGGEVLRAHALADLLPAATASAHLAGDIHVHGLHRPASLHGLTVSLASLAAEGVPGAEGRSPRKASRGSRRLLALAGRGLRTLGAYASHGVAVPAANLLLAGLVADGDGSTAPRSARDGDDPAAFREEAWHLLLEASAEPGGDPAELELLTGVPAWAAHRPVAVVDGGHPVDLSQHADHARALARALVAVRAGGEGLPPRRSLPPLTFVVERESLADPRARLVLSEALTAALAGAPCRLVMQRGPAPLVGVGTWRMACPAALTTGEPSSLRALLVQRVTLNLPRAAFRAPTGDLDGFLSHCDLLLERAVDAHLARRSFLATLSGAEGGILSPLFRRRKGRGGGSTGAPGESFDPAEGVYSVAVTGLNEAVAHLLGEELHQSDAAGKVGARVLASLGLRVREAARRADLPLRFDAGDDADVAERFREADSRDHPREQAQATEGRRCYAPGVSLRAGAPLDLLLRLDRQGRLHGAVDGGAFHFDPKDEPGVSAEGLLALVEKAFLHTAVHQIVLGEGAR
jgi:ribonucleoside-triphosphate reductase